MLEAFDAASKPKVIREVKALVPNLTLIEVRLSPRFSLPYFEANSSCSLQAKKFVESLPKVLKENLSKEDADKLKATFEGIGATVKLD